MTKRHRASITLVLDRSHLKQEADRRTRSYVATHRETSWWRNTGDERLLSLATATAIAAAAAAATAAAAAAR
eukprot:CAMPEP_0202765918 /NCGR_PEP_ID=MMETSP1388-20130828/29274_1 /ASSEMBLY_ACC=CAM_ASM_000864 /TAXON_ID=37098 /ORGANISM="Isochrysis sp, Strain CCMP1244" /LENGTH=71 /DNA_ID=CAMNT_0049434503 /DNA_START=14 /DNA_END=226 /DNA_ORIENTATION=+